METNRTNTGFDSVIKLFSFIYILLIICGLCYNYFFYKNFGITITEYIDLSDALLLFIPLLAELIVVIGIFSLMFYFIFKSIIFKEENNVLVNNQKRNRFLLFMFIFWLILMLIIYVQSFFFKPNYRLMYMTLALLIIFFAPIFFELLSRFFNNKMNISIPNIYRDVTAIIIICVTIVIWTSYSKSESVKRRYGYRNFEIQFKNGDPKFLSDSNSYYLGRTKNYIFIYDFKINKSRVLNTSDTKEIIIDNP